MSNDGAYYGHRSKMIEVCGSPDMREFFPEYSFYVMVDHQFLGVSHDSYRTFDEALEAAEGRANDLAIPLVLVE